MISRLLAQYHGGISCLIQPLSNIHREACATARGGRLLPHSKYGRMHFHRRTLECMFSNIRVIYDMVIW